MFGWLYERVPDAGPSASRTTPSSARPRRTRSRPSWPRCTGPGCTRWSWSSMRSRSCSPSASPARKPGRPRRSASSCSAPWASSCCSAPRSPTRTACRPGSPATSTPGSACRVADQIANDMILGTSMYKLGYRATVFEPVTEAGWGILAGIGKPGARRSFYIDNDQAATRHGPRHRRCAAAAGVLPEPPRRPDQPGPARRAGRRGRRSGPPGRTPPGTRPSGAAGRAAARHLRPVGARAAHHRPRPGTGSAPGRSAAASTARPSTGAARPTPTSSDAVTERNRNRRRRLTPGGC